LQSVLKEYKGGQVIFLEILLGKIVGTSAKMGGFGGTREGGRGSEGDPLIDAISSDMPPLRTSWILFYMFSIV